jgi:ABC-type multidrug transport system permease subunit
MAIWALVKKELRLLLRDRVAAILLLGMPLLFILVLGLLLGEGFGQKSDDKLRISVVDLDEGPCPIVNRDALRLAAVSTTGLLAAPGGQGAWLAAGALYPGRTTYRTWSEVVRADLAGTAEIRVEMVPSEEEAQRLIRDHKRAAIIVFTPAFSTQLNRCSFLTDGINPFHRDGVYLDKVRVNLLRDEMQPGAAGIIEQVAQVSLLRVILPSMIGRAFDRLSDAKFIQILGEKVNLPMPPAWRSNFVLKSLVPEKLQLGQMLKMASGGDPRMAAMYQEKVGQGVQSALDQQFINYNLRGQTWADLNKAQAKDDGGAEITDYVNQDGSGFLKRGAQRYQTLVPAYAVMFAFFLVLTVGWVFVAERRQGTLKRLRAAPVSQAEILLGKLLPCFVISLGQGIFLLVAGRLLFGMRWGPDQWSFWQQASWLLLVVFSTSLAAMGLALLVAVLARTEIQVAIYGALPVLVMALIGGCVLPREMMPEQTQKLSLFTPQGWALDAYRELLNPSAHYEPNLTIVTHAAAVLSGFGITFLALAWAMLRLKDSNQ